VSAVAEIEISGRGKPLGILVASRPFLRAPLHRTGGYVDIMPEEMLPASRLIAQIEEARASGARVLLLHLERSGGGDADEGFELYAALRAASSAGCTVVVYAADHIGSTATFWLLAGDVVVVDPQVEICVHSAVSDSEERTQQINAAAFEIYKERSYTPNHELRNWLSRQGGDVALLRADNAIDLHWADFVGDFADARALAASIASGVKPRTARSSMLEARAETAAARHRPAPGAPANLTILPGTATNPGAIADVGSTRGANVDNIWPNPGSEISPPDGASVPGDSTSAEWDYRFNAGAGAYSGSWVRQFGSGGVGLQKFGVIIPCSPGESFVFSAQVKVTAGPGRAGVGVDYLDTNGAPAGSGMITYYSGATWAAVDLSGVNPPLIAGAGAVKARLFLVVDGNGIGTTTAQFDSIYARRTIDNKVIYNEAWIAPTLAGTWANVGAGNTAAGYMKDANGFVNLRGLITGGALNTALFTLPIGYRPVATITLFAMANSGASPCQVTISSVGVVSQQGGASNVNLGLDGLSFDTR